MHSPTGEPSPAYLVEVGWQAGVAVVLEEPFYLLGGDAGEREVRQVLFLEEPHLVRFYRSRRGLGQDLAQKDQLVEVVRNGGWPCRSRS